MSDNAHNSRPEVQARRFANARDPEYVRRQALVKGRKGKKQREVAKAWFIAWQTDGKRSSDYPDLADWEAQQRALGWWTHYEAMVAANKLTNRWWPERETISYADWKAREGIMPETATSRPFKLLGPFRDG